MVDAADFFSANDTKSGPATHKHKAEDAARAINIRPCPA
jgi:hypothetical protein